MNASEIAILAFASCLACACAETYGVPPAPEAASLVPPIAGVEASFGGAAAMPSMVGTGGVGGMSPPPLGEPCVRNDMIRCPCEGTDVQGQRICMFDMASPMDGFFSECQGCTAPEPVDMPEPSCTDAMRNGAETSTDCGGSDCAPCSLGSACMADADCADATCVSSVCTMQPSGGTGGASGADAGMPPIDEPIDEPVEDCEGVPVGTECDRDCILPTNTARCNSRGNCSCL